MEDEKKLFRQSWNVLHKKVRRDLKTSIIITKSDNAAALLNKKAYELMTQGDREESQRLLKKALLLAKYNGSVHGQVLYNLSLLRCLEHNHKNSIELLYQCLKTQYGIDEILPVCNTKIAVSGLLGEVLLQNQIYTTVSELLVKSNLSEDLIIEADHALKVTQDRNLHKDENLLVSKLTKYSNNINVCDKVEISKSKKFGRHVVARANIKKGDVILVDQPFGVHSSTYCNKCFSRCIIIIPCVHCCLSVYCSEECRNEDEQVHDFECDLFQRETFSGLDVKSLLGLRLFLTVLQSGFKKNAAADVKFNTFGDVKINFLFIRSFYPGLKTISKQMRQYAAVNSVILTAYLISNSKFMESMKNRKLLGDLPNDDLVDTIGAHLLQLVVTLEYNSYIYGHKNNDVSAMLYPTYSLFNHSCAPNTIKYLSDSKLILKAAEDITAGQQIFTTYGVIANLGSTKQRKLYLQRYYRFICSCKLCSVENDVSVEAIIKCANCTSYASIQGKKLVCSACNHSQDIELKAVLGIKNIYTLLTSYQATGNVDNLYKAHETAEAFQLNRTHSLIAPCYYELGLHEIKRGHMQKGFKFIGDLDNINHNNYSHFITVLDSLEEHSKRVYFSKTCYRTAVSKKVLNKCTNFFDKMADVINLYQPKESYLNKIAVLQKFFTILKNIAEFEKTANWKLKGSTI